MLAPPRPPTPDELEALIKEARARQIRRRLQAAAGIATAAALALGTYAATTGGTRGVTPRAPIGPSAAPLCRSSQLSTSFFIGAAAGTALGPLFLANRSGRACFIPATRPLVRIAFRGKDLPIAERSWPPDDQLGKPAGRVLAPGRKVYVELGWRGSCPRPAAAPTRGAVTVTMRLGRLSVTTPESTPEGIPGVPGCAQVARPAVLVSRPLRS